MEFSKIHDSGSTTLELALYNHMETLERLKAAGKKVQNYKF